MPEERRDDSDAEGFEHTVLRRLSEIGTLVEDHAIILDDHSRTLFGHEDERRRYTDPGVVHVVSELASAFKDVRAVAKAGWAMLGLVGFSTALSLVSLLMTRS